MIHCKPNVVDHPSFASALRVRKPEPVGIPFTLVDGGKISLVHTQETKQILLSFLYNKAWYGTYFRIAYFTQDNSDIALLTLY